MKTILNLGCGNDYLTGQKGAVVINVDLNHEVKCDIALDLDNPKVKWPWEKESVDGIIAKHIVEHIQNRDFFMNMCWKVLIPTGVIFIEAPLAGSNAYWKDPTHVSGWVKDTFRYYCDWNMCPANKRKTWNMINCYEERRGDDDIVICELEKPKK